MVLWCYIARIRCSFFLHAFISAHWSLVTTVVWTDWCWDVNLRLLDFGWKEGENILENESRASQWSTWWTRAWCSLSVVYSFPFRLFDLGSWWSHGVEPTVFHQPTTCRRSIFMDVMATCGAQGSCYVKNDGTVPFEGQCNVSTLTPGGRESEKVLLIVPLRLLYLGIYYQLDSYFGLRWLIDLLKISLSLSVVSFIFVSIELPLFYLIWHQKAPLCKRNGPTKTDVNQGASQMVSDRWSSRSSCRCQPGLGPNTSLRQHGACWMMRWVEVGRWNGLNSYYAQLLFELLLCRFL